MKNDRGQTMTVGVIMTTFIAILVGVILFLPVAQEVGDATSTLTIANITFTAPANGGVHNFTAYKALSGLTIINDSNGVVIDAGNYTITDNQIVDGALVATLTVDAATLAGVTWDMSGTAQAPDYIDDSGGRAMANLIPIFFALMVVAVALYPVVKNGLGGM